MISWTGSTISGSATGYLLQSPADTHGYGTARDTFLIGQPTTSVFPGSIPLSSKWSINIGNISYDFQAKGLAYPDLGFTRDLHCWQLSLRWQPARGTYQFTITVKPGTLDFLKIPYRKNNYDAGF